MVAKGFAMFGKALPNLREEVVSIVAEGNRVACEVIETAVFSGPMELPTGTLAPTGRSYTLPVASFFRLDAGGSIVEQRTYWDTANWAQQIGIDASLFAPQPEPAPAVSGR
jgi:predicted ester cyclase